MKAKTKKHDQKRRKIKLGWISPHLTPLHAIMNPNLMHSGVLRAPSGLQAGGCEWILDKPPIIIPKILLIAISKAFKSV